MQKRLSLVLDFALVASLAMNAYLFSLVIKWQEAWAQQIHTTAIVEKLYQKSGADVSYDSVTDLVKREFGEYRTLSAQNGNSASTDSDEQVIIVNRQRLVFHRGKYSGSAADVPDGLVHWGYGE